MKAKFLLFLAPALLAATPVITITTTCQGQRMDPMTTHDGCMATGASATAFAAINIASDASQYSSIVVKQTADAQGAMASDPAAATRQYDASATSTLSMADSLVTAGPPRAGYIQLYTSAYALYSPGYGIGTGEIQMPRTLQGENINLTPYNQIGFHTFSFELGVPFSVSYQGSFYTASSYFEGNGSAGDDLAYYFRFLEADQATPVMVSNPEPATIGLLGLSFLLVGYWKWKQKCQLN